MPSQEQQIEHISIDLIDDPVNAMRSELDITSLHELADDIKRNGLIEPVIVRDLGGRYEVVAGHRRTSACKIAGMIKLPCIVRTLTDHEAIGIKVSENFHRKDIDPIDEALFYAELNLTYKTSIEEIAKAIGRREEYVQGRLDLLLYPQNLMLAIKEKKISLAAAKWLAQIENESDRNIYIEYAVKDGITEDNARNWYNNWYYSQQQPNPTPAAAYSEEQIRDFGRPKIVCQKCGIGSDIRELQQVYIHRAGCESYLAEYQQPEPDPSLQESETVATIPLNTASDGG